MEESPSQTSLLADNQRPQAATDVQPTFVSKSYECSANNCPVVSSKNTNVQQPFAPIFRLESEGFNYGVNTPAAAENYRHVTPGSIDRTYTPHLFDVEANFSPPVVFESNSYSNQLRALYENFIPTNIQVSYEATSTATTASMSVATSSRRSRGGSGRSRSSKTDHMLSRSIRHLRTNDLPGIGNRLSKTLAEKNIFRASTIIGKYIYLDFKDDLFKKWLHKKCGANERNLEECLTAVKEYCDSVGL